MNLDADTTHDWIGRLNDLKCDLLQVMGSTLNFDFSVDYLKREGYLPRYYTDTEEEQLLMRRRMLQALRDDGGIRVVVTEYPARPRDSSR